MSFGTQTFGDETFGGGGTGLAITSISPSTVSRTGGSIVELTGTFPTDETFNVTVNGVTAFGGVSGQKDNILTADGLTISFVAPVSNLTGSLTVEVTALPSNDTAQISLTVVERNFSSSVFEMRRMFPPWYAAGPRRLELEPQE